MIASPIQAAAMPTNAREKNANSRSRVARQKRRKKSAATRDDIASTPHMKVFMAVCLSRFPREPENEQQHADDCRSVAVPEEVVVRRQEDQVDVQDHIVDGEEYEAEACPEEQPGPCRAIAAQEQHRAHDAGDRAQNVDRLSHLSCPFSTRKRRR